MCYSQTAPLSWKFTHCRFGFFPSPFLFNVEIAKPFLKEVKTLHKTFIHWLSPGFGHLINSDIPSALPSYAALCFIPSLPEIPLFLFFHGYGNLVLLTLISIHKPIPLLFSITLPMWPVQFLQDSHYLLVCFSCSFVLLAYPSWPWRWGMCNPFWCQGLSVLQIQLSCLARLPATWKDGVKNSLHRKQAVQESALQPRWTFWDLSQYQLLIGSF